MEQVPYSNCIYTNSNLVYVFEGATLSYSVSQLVTEFQWHALPAYVLFWSWTPFFSSSIFTTASRLNFYKCCFRTSQKHGYHRFLLLYNWQMLYHDILPDDKHSVSSDQNHCSIHWWIVNCKTIQLVQVASISLVPMPFIWFNQYAFNFWLLMRNIFIFSYLKWNQYFLVIVLIN